MGIIFIVTGALVFIGTLVCVMVETYSKCMDLSVELRIARRDIRILDEDLRAVISNLHDYISHKNSGEEILKTMELSDQVRSYYENHFESCGDESCGC
jgi:hypothetical protein